MPLEEYVDRESIADRTERYTGADLENLVRKAGLEALRNDPDADTVPMAFFEDSLRDTRPSVTPEIFMNNNGRVSGN